MIVIKINRRLLKSHQKNERLCKDKLETFQKSFEIIYGIHGEVSADELLRQLQSKEAETFALYNCMLHVFLL